MLAVAAEHGITAGVAIRWSDVPRPYSPAIVLVEHGFVHGMVPTHRERIQFIGRAVLDWIAQCAKRACMACGSVAAPPTHIALQASGSSYIALLCSECQEGAVLDGHDFWFVIGRHDPLMLEHETESEPPVDGADSPGEEPSDGWLGPENDWRDGT